MMLAIGSLFSGIGGFELGLSRAIPCHPVWFCDTEPFCRSVLARRYFGTPGFQDVSTLTPEQTRRVNPGWLYALVGGVPCQDISVSGSGLGLDGARSGLWSEMARLVRELRPHQVFIENSPALVTRGLDVILRDLHAAGYNAEWQILNSQMVGGLHHRRRIYLRAFQLGSFRFSFARPQEAVSRALARVQAKAHSDEPEQRLLRPGEMSPAERKLRIHALGNAVDPRVAQLFGELLIDEFSDLKAYSYKRPGVFPCGFMEDGKSYAAPRLAPPLKGGALPTLRASDWRSGKVSAATMQKNSRPLCEILGGHINPTWAEWYMGFPVGWTAL